MTHSKELNQAKELLECLIRCCPETKIHEKYHSFAQEVIAHALWMAKNAAYDEFHNWLGRIGKDEPAVYGPGLQLDWILRDVPPAPTKEELHEVK